jgi:DNA-binding transcriptional regulator LsrR (DeoR family)
MRYGAAGEINNQLYDREGKTLMDRIHDLRDCFINILSLDEIREIAGQRKKRKVIAVATGAQKLTAIKVALETNLTSVLITGRADAEALLR